MSQNIKFAIVGLGWIGKRHSEMVKGNPNAELVAVIDSNEALAKEMSEKYDVPYFTSDEAFHQSDIDSDVVCVCTPNGLHSEQAKNAINNGNHVVCEKPLGLFKANCEEVLHLALQNSKQVFCVMQNRYSPPSVWLKSIMESKVMGDIFLVQINCYWNRDDRYYGKSPWKGTLALDGGPLYTQFSHFIDIMFWLFGDIENINARFKNFNHHENTEFEDSGFVNFDFMTGGMGELNYSTSIYDKNLESSLTIIGEKGTIKVGGQYMDTIEYCNIEDYTMPELPPSNPPNDYGDYKGSAANHHFVIQNVIDTLEGKSTVSTNALEGLKVVEIIENIYKSRKLPIKGNN